jgi:trehalose-phosphatase
LEHTVARTFDVEVMAGKANLEVRPRFVNKGEIVKRLVEAYGNKPGDPPEFVLCMGDDSTDEGMCLDVWKVSGMWEVSRISPRLSLKQSSTLPKISLKI